MGWPSYITEHTICCFWWTIHVYRTVLDCKMRGSLWQDQRRTRSVSRYRCVVLISRQTKAVADPGTGGPGGRPLPYWPKLGAGRIQLREAVCLRHGGELPFKSLTFAIIWPLFCMKMAKKSFSFSGIRPSWPPIRGSAREPRCGFRPHAPVIGSRSIRSVVRPLRPLPLANPGSAGEAKDYQCRACCMITEWWSSK